MARTDRAAFRRHAVTWLPWSNPMPPATADEARFVADLRTEVSDRREPHRRSDTTALLAALRGVLDVETLLEQTPGLRPAQLWSAYFDLEERSFESEAAWRCIVESPTPATMHDPRPRRPTARRDQLRGGRGALGTPPPRRRS